MFAFLNPDRGLLNSIIGKRILWYQSPQYWPFILVFMNAWKGTGYNMVVYLASITGIDGSLYEAAMLDGASKWQQTRYITLPMLKFILITMFILNIGRIFYSDFGLFWQVTQGLPNSLYNVASTFDTFIYSSIQNSTPIGRTAAASLFQSVCCCATVLLANFIVSKIDPKAPSSKGGGSKNGYRYGKAQNAGFCARFPEDEPRAPGHQRAVCRAVRGAGGHGHHPGDLRVRRFHLLGNLHPRSGLQLLPV